ncbi:MAG: peptide-methionine (S)-S-oxide reductase MsrA [Chitinophagaceae bacterium]|nr:peptide-methionine (S)-S-oxide reductase MsrA [Chitinophagaceae bacterium]MCZ2397353.1 peptide-methionine (S)-S-oxide reductase MsrA [Chitinophagales bacterium]
MKNTAILWVLLSFAFGSCGQAPAGFSAIPSAKKINKLKLSQATFAAGCFWCEEAIFESVKGVYEAVSGYAGGTKPNPTYYDLGSGPTCHAEMVNVYYDSTVVDYPTLLKIYFASQDPTQVNGQGPDMGYQYRSVVFFRNEKEKRMTENYIRELNQSGKYDRPLSVQLTSFTKFWEAEPGHQDFVKRNPENPYVLHESIPRIQRFQKQFPQLIKPGEKY